MLAELGSDCGLLWEATIHKVGAASSTLPQLLSHYLHEHLRCLSSSPSLWPTPDCLRLQMLLLDQTVVPSVAYSKPRMDPPSLSKYRTNFHALLSAETLAVISLYYAKISSVSEQTPSKVFIIKRSILGKVHCTVHATLDQDLTDYTVYVTDRSKNGSYVCGRYLLPLCLLYSLWPSVSYRSMAPAYNASSRSRSKAARLSSLVL